MEISEHVIIYPGDAAMSILSSSHYLKINEYYRHTEKQWSISCVSQRKGSVHPRYSDDGPVL